jgi:hypothetical protein
MVMVMPSPYVQCFLSLPASYFVLARMYTSAFTFCPHLRRPGLVPVKFALGRYVS